MVRSLRHSRLLSLLLLGASPGLGGVAMPVLHPCPVDTPWMAGAGAEAGAGHHHETAPEQGGTHAGTCQCLGACQVSSAAVPKAAGTPVVEPSVVERAAQRLTAGAPFAARPDRRQPPATAPPTA
ncbi:MAG: hypothetical protein AB7R55_18585 [Gemmatimonadales bacterium]